FFFYNPTSPTKIYTLSLHDALPISMPTIQVDFDVFKALTARRLTEDVSENDVLRELLRLPKQPTRPVRSDVPAPDDWVTKGVRVPAGTELRATYKGQTYLGRVNSGALE